MKKLLIVCASLLFTLGRLPYRQSVAYGRPYVLPTEQK